MQIAKLLPFLKQVCSPEEYDPPHRHRDRGCGDRTTGPELLHEMNPDLRSEIDARVQRTGLLSRGRGSTTNGDRKYDG